MDLEGVVPSEKKSDGKRQILYDLTQMWNIKKNTNSQRQAIDQCLPVGKGVGKGMDCMVTGGN